MENNLEILVGNYVTEFSTSEKLGKSRQAVIEHGDLAAVKNRCNIVHYYKLCIWN